MIVNIPQSEQFEENGLLFLNLAWDIVSDLFIEIGEIRDWDEEIGDNVFEEMAWEEASHRLSNSLVLVHQGLEFFLKSKIVEVSPYLLISNSPKDWSKSFETKETSFEEFRTIDAQDLIKVHNTFCERRLQEKFKNLVDDIRTARNSVMHSVGKKGKVKPEDVWKWILEILFNLKHEVSWVNLRKSYLSKRTHAFLNPDFVYGKLAWEWNHLHTILSSSGRRKYLKFTNARRYVCTDCTHAMQSFMHTYKNVTSAQLNPNTPSATNLKCSICGLGIPIVRKKCIHMNCLGNVIGARDSICLTCGKYNQE